MGRAVLRSCRLGKNHGWDSMENAEQREQQLDEGEIGQEMKG